mgnify:CR=1 FL=1
MDQCSPHMVQGARHPRSVLAGDPYPAGPRSSCRNPTPFQGLGVVTGREGSHKPASPAGRRSTPIRVRRPASFNSTGRLRSRSRSRVEVCRSHVGAAQVPSKWRRCVGPAALQVLRGLRKNTLERPHLCSLRCERSEPRRARKVSHQALRGSSLSLLAPQGAVIGLAPCTTGSL